MASPLNSVSVNNISNNNGCQGYSLNDCLMRRGRPGTITRVLRIVCCIVCWTAIDFECIALAICRKHPWKN